jgi:hypothetical protein
VFNGIPVRWIFILPGEHPISTSTLANELERARITAQKSNISAKRRLAAFEPTFTPASAPWNDTITGTGERRIRGSQKSPLLPK